MMFSFSAATKESLDLPAGQDGRLWPHTYQAQMRVVHRHDELEMNLVTAGRAAYLLGDRRYDLRPNTLVWLFPAQDHILLDESPDFRMWIGVFKPTLLERACTSPETSVLREPDPAGRFYRSIGEGRCEKLAALFAEVAAAENARHNAGLGYVLLSAWEAYQATNELPGGAEVHPAVEQAARLLRDEADPLSMEQIAARVGLSASRLSRLFHAQTGIPLVEFRNAQRLRRFLSLYGRGGRVSMLEAALDAGFGSYPQFHRIFTQRMKCSPSNYRRRLHMKTTTQNGGT